MEISRVNGEDKFGGSARLFIISIQRVLLIVRRVRKIAKSDYQLLHVRPSVCLCPSAWNISGPTNWIFIKFDICVFFRKFVEKIQVSLKSDKNNGYDK